MHVQNDDVLVAAARRAAEQAYAPYSNFRVGAAILTAAGEIVTGCNVENAAYGSSVCAEANAITTVIAQGERGMATIAVACIDAESVDGAYPCGDCRQLINEFGIGRVIVTTGVGEGRSHSGDELLPYGFTLEP
jgi:cytidine deaminase